MAVAVVVVVVVAVVIESMALASGTGMAGSDILKNGTELRKGNGMKRGIVDA